MQREQFDRLVTRLEERFARRPAALQWWLALWVVLGYGAFLTWLVLTVILGCAALVAGALTLGGGGIFLLILGGVLVTLGSIQTVILMSAQIEPPKGRKLERGDVPQLFSVLDELQRTARCRVHRVLLTPDLNAGVFQTPRLGILGWNVKHLSLGLPLLEVLAPEELQAVLAHEFAHLSAEHGRFGNWLYRLRSTWERLFQQLHADRAAGVRRWLQSAVNRFIDWYWPRFNARAFVLCREFEYFADAAAVEAAGAPVAAHSLWRLECYSRQLNEKFWSEVWLGPKTAPEPPDNIAQQMIAALAVPPEPEDAARWMNQACRQLTDHVDTHPCLSERAAAMGIEVASFVRQGYPTLPGRSAAEWIFGSSRGQWSREVSAQWQSDVRRNWHARHARASMLQRRLGSLDQHASNVRADPLVLWEKAIAVLDVDGPAAAEPLLAELLTIQPTHSRANLILGQHWLEQGRPEGAALLERVLAGDDDWVPAAGQVLSEYFRNSGQHDRWSDVRARLDRYELAAVAARKERGAVRPSDRFLEHGLDVDELQPLLEVLAAQFELHAAWLVRKQLEHFPERRLFVLCVRGQPNWFGASSTSRDQRLVTSLVPRLLLPGQVLTISPQGGFKPLARQIMKSPGAQIFPRHASPNSSFAGASTSPN